MSKLDELQKRYDALGDELLKLKAEMAEEERKVELPAILWKPESGDEVWLLDETSYMSSMWVDNVQGNILLAKGYLYPSYKPAEKADRQREALMKVLRRVAELNHEAGWVCDFSIPNQDKITLCWSHLINMATYKNADTQQILPKEYYAKSGVWEQVVEEMPEAVKMGMWGIE